MRPATEAEKLYAEDTKEPCEQCGGQGMIPWFDGHGNELGQDECKHCSGTGRVEKLKPQPTTTTND